MYNFVGCGFDAKSVVIVSEFIFVFFNSYPILVKFRTYFSIAHSSVSVYETIILKSFQCSLTLATNNIWLIFMRNTVNVIITCRLTFIPHELLIGVKYC